MKGFYISVSNGLLDPKHFKAMKGDKDCGVIWLFLWLLDKMTSITEEGIGFVLGGKPIRFGEITADLKMSRRTYVSWIKLLRDEGYINTERTPHGLILSVNRAKKNFKKKVMSNEAPISKNGVMRSQTHSDAQSTQHLIKTIQDNNNIKKEIYKERKLATPSLEGNGIKKRRFSTIDSITDKDFLEISLRYKVSPAFVRLQFEKLRNYCESSGRNYKDYKAALRNFVLGDIQKSAERRSHGASRVSINPDEL